LRTLLLLILAAIWAAVLLPPWLQNRRERRPNDSIVSFRSQMGTLQRTAPTGGSLMNTRMSRREAQRRRRDILLTLACAASLTLVLAVMLGGPVIALHLFVDVLLVAYVALLVNAQQAATMRPQRRPANVHRLPARREAEQRPAMVLRRTGS
jgi:hypothetical protein